ncbi:MAG: endonuclease [Lachnoclostridium sp.]|nr:endonuclease [Lachnoclostridium sp.]
MFRRNIFSIVALAAVITSPATLPPEFNGRSGASLRSAVARYAEPSRYLDPAEAFVDITGGTDRHTFFDPFSAARATLDDSWTFTGVIPVEYWSLSDIYGNASRDLVNHIPISAEVTANRRDLVPGVVEQPEFDNGVWRAGRSTVSGIPTEFYEPPAEYRGDFARIIFYMSTLYPTDSWTQRAYMLMDGTDYPVLNRYGRQTLMKYHREDPVSDEELSRSAAIAALQGKGNPFVEYPELAEYLWGDKVDEVVDIPDVPVPLKGTYSLSDEKIYLQSPYVPDDATWSIDDKATNAEWLPISSLGEGKHKLRYYSPSTHAQGILTILITR